MMKKNKLIAGLVAGSLLLSGCFGDNDKKRLQATDKAAIINTVAADYSDSNLELVDLLNTDTPLTAVAGDYSTGQSDYTVDVWGEFFYRIGRSGIDTVSKYSIKAPETAIVSFDTRDAADDPTANPYSLVFVNDTKAYLIRYASDMLWIVNPSAESEANFKTGEIDLSAYRNNDTAPGMAAGVIVDDKLYLVLQRLNGWTPEENESYAVVIDTTSDEEIDTRAPGSAETLKGIRLQTANPQSIVYQPDAGLFVQSIGTWSGDYIGGIEKINTTDYSTSVIIDDDAGTGRMSGLALINDTLGYIISYAGWQNTSLYSFDPSNGDIADSAINNLSSIDIKHLAVDDLDRLWVSIGDASNPRVAILDTMSDSIVHTVQTEMNPGKVVFAAAFVTIED